jgi:hypothetical protein
VVELTNVAVDLLDAQEMSDRDALAFVDSLGVIEHMRFSTLAREAAEWADFLRLRGVQSGDRVVVLAGRDRSWRSALLGVLEAGGVAVPCHAAVSVAELRAIVNDMGAAAFVSHRARPDLDESDGIPVLSADELDSSRPPSRLRNMAMPGDIALVLDGAEQTHASLLAQAESAGKWLELGEGERVWSTTAADGSVESILLLLASWRAGAEIIAVEQSLDQVEQLELLHRFQPAVVWFSDDEYAALAAAATAEPAWAKLGSIRQALASVEGTDAPAAFGHVFGVGIALASAGPLAGFAEVEAAPTVVDEREAAEADKRRREEEERLEDERRREEKLARRREKEEATRLRKAEEQRRREEEENRKRTEREAEQRRREEAKRKLAEKAEREAAAAAAAEARRRADEVKRAEREAAKAEQQRRREEDEKRKRSEKAEREAAAAAAAEARRLAEEAKRAEREAAKGEEQRRREEGKNRKLAERAAAEERRRAEKAEREAAKAEKHRRAEEQKRLEEERRREAQHAKELQNAEAQRIREEEKNRKLAARAEAAERRRAEKAQRAERERLAVEAKARQAEAERLRAEEAERERLEGEDVDAETARERRERIAHEERQRESEIPREAVHAKSDREMDIVSRISQYGMGTQVVERKQREDDAGELATVQPDERRDPSG